jgi:modulator of drug activity B
VKKYIDEVFTEGHGSLYASDGRTRSDASQKYGSGGLIQGKQYMLSLTWNAPQQAFDDPSDFFEAKGVDAVYFPFHKANQFLGMTGLPTFLCVDVMKRPNIEGDVARYEQHLIEVFGLKA